MLKSYQWWVGVVAYKILETARVQKPPTLFSLDLRPGTWTRACHVNDTQSFVAFVVKHHTSTGAQYDNIC